MRMAVGAQERMSWEGWSSRGRLPGRGGLVLGFEAKGQEKLTVEERCSRLGLSTNKSMGLGSGWGREAPKRAK